MKTVMPGLPASAPHSNGNRFSRAIGRGVLRLGGWRVVGEWPDLPKVVMIVAPHSSAWDVIWGLAAKIAISLGIVFIGKKEAFWGPIGWLLRKFGGVPVDRSAPGGIIDQMAGRIRESDRMWFVLSPEGTRRKVEKWKTGFWKIAHRAKVPVFGIAFDYPDRTIYLCEVFELTEDMAADIERIKATFVKYRGKYDAE